jgi:hypothetical protein
MADAVGSGVAETSLAQPVKLDDLMLAITSSIRCAIKTLSPPANSTRRRASRS